MRTEDTLRFSPRSLRVQWQRFTLLVVSEGQMGLLTMQKQVLLGLLVVLSCSWIGNQLYSQEDTGDKPGGRRLPNYYSQVGLRQSQREEIYEIQDRYAEQIEELIRQVEELRKQRDVDTEKVLDEVQRAELKRLTAAAAARSKARREARVKEATDSGSPAPAKKE